MANTFAARTALPFIFFAIFDNFHFDILLELLFELLNSKVEKYYFFFLNDWNLQ
jgi:hypothetical protein